MLESGKLNYWVVFLFSINEYPCAMCMAEIIKFVLNMGVTITQSTFRPTFFVEL